jgi:signal peptidase I
MQKTRTEQQKSTAREYTEAIIIALILALFIRTFIIQAFKIPSGSMLQTLLIGDHILVSKFIYGIKNPFSGTVLVPIKTPKRGDIVVFKYPKNPKIDYIKRVIATAGDTVEIKDKKVYLNNHPIDETSYKQHIDNNIFTASQNIRDNFGPVTVPEGHLFVMGDNRDNSQDSRFWGFVDLKAVRGKAFIIYWSWDVTKPFFSWKRISSARWSRIGDILH